MIKLWSGKSIQFMALLYVVTCSSLLATSAQADTTVTGPIPGTPFDASPIDLAAHGYVEEEYFIEGTASAYTSAEPLESDGVWTVTPTVSEPYKTRILVRRPADPKRFNGTVLTEWYNVTAGSDIGPDWGWANAELMRSGYVWVGVSAQSVGVGNLLVTNPGRYGSLAHPGDSFSYDIFSQAGSAIKYPGSVDPLGDLLVEAVIAAGESQSASRLGTYFNAIHPLAGIYDGFLNHSRGDGTSDLSQAPQPSVPVPSVVFSRTDLNVPLLQFETEGDVWLFNFAAARQPDSAFYRLWELSGNAHTDAFLVGDSGFIVCDFPLNDGPQYLVLRAAIDHLNRWVREGTSPPEAPRIETESAGPFTVILRDDFGNALGGIRTPLLDVPIATLTSEINTGAFFCPLFGKTIPFDDATLASLYPSHGTYVSRFNQATTDAVKAGFILKADEEALKVEAAQSEIGM
jgi:hypothetical protein